jgi:signal transduction histidine kinase
MTSPAYDRGRTAAHVRTSSLPPGLGTSWKGNLLVFGILILLVITYFSWQSMQARQDFLKRAAGRSKMLASIISFSLNNANASQHSLELTIHDFLASTADFADYLDSFEPFSADELKTFAEKAKLTGIRIIHADGTVVEGSTRKIPDTTCRAAANQMQYYATRSLYVLPWPRTYEPGCILVGFDTNTTEKLMAKIGSERLMKKISGLPWIEYVRLESLLKHDLPKNLAHIFQTDDGKNIVETRMIFDDHNMLVVGFDAARYVRKMARLRGELLIFSAALLTLGLFLSWLLYRYQSATLRHIRNFDHQLAEQREEAALGRATSTISHEIKNPLNAIGMGLQRLELELDAPEEYRQLISSMRRALIRTSDIVSTLKRHSQPVTPRYEEVYPNDIIEAVITLYRGRCLENNISLHFEGNFQGTIMADEALLSQVVENLLKNAVEAQVDGGWIKIYTRPDQAGNFILEIKNPGFTLEPAAAAKIFEPYYTRKTTGTGLGLSISKRIIEAHEGQIYHEVPAAGILKLTVKIPIVPVGG